MNPLLIALARDTNTTRDGGAGRIFFISTIGSVAGVLVTAFYLIANFTNFQTMLMLASLLGLIAAAYTLFSNALSPARKRLLILGCLSVSILSIGFYAAREFYLAAQTPGFLGGYRPKGGPKTR